MVFAKTNTCRKYFNCPIFNSEILSDLKSGEKFCVALTLQIYQCWTVLFSNIKDDTNGE